MRLGGEGMSEEVSLSCNHVKCQGEETVKMKGRRYESLYDRLLEERDTRLFAWSSIGLAVASSCVFRTSEHGPDPCNSVSVLKPLDFNQV